MFTEIEVLQKRRMMCISAQSIQYALLKTRSASRKSSTCVVALIVWEIVKPNSHKMRPGLACRSVHWSEYNTQDELCDKSRSDGQAR